MFGGHAPVSEDAAVPRVPPSRTKLVELSGAFARGDDGSVWRIGMANDPPTNVLDLTLALPAARPLRGIDESPRRVER